jgi:DnaJ-class molecular chaperone
VTDPYEILDLNADAGEDEIRQRYLALVREFSPERAPQRFAEIRHAYDQLRDPIRSLERRLFNVTATDTFDTLQAAQQQRLGKQRIPTQVLLSLAEA